MQCTPRAQAQQAAAIHAKQAQQARAELEEVRRRAADSIRASSASTAQLRELGELRARLLDAESSTAGSAHELQAHHLSSPWQSSCLLTLPSIPFAHARTASINSSHPDNGCLHLMPALSRHHLLESKAANSSHIPWVWMRHRISLWLALKEACMLTGKAEGRRGRCGEAADDCSGACAGAQSCRCAQGCKGQDG